jgi:hypothetical protein
LGFVHDEDDTVLGRVEMAGKVIEHEYGSLARASTEVACDAIADR